MGKTYSIYMDKNESTKVDELIKNGIKKADAVKKILYDRDKTLHKDHEDIIRILENIRSCPILQVGSKEPLVTVTVPGKESKKKGFWHRLLKQ